MAETMKHRQLKTLATDWLKERGSDAVAVEVKLPLSNYRVDVAGYCSRRILSDRLGDTFAIECKQSRADFLRDAGLEGAVVLAHGELENRLARLRDLLATHLPQCRKNESLFSEYDSYDFSDWHHKSWSRLSKQLQTLENRLDHGVKFARIARFGCANFCYLAVEENVVLHPSEVPLGWGLLKRTGNSLSVEKEALRLESKSPARLKLLERIAKSNSRF